MGKFNLGNAFKRAFSAGNIKQAFQPVANAFNPETIKREFTRPAGQVLSKENIADFGDRLGTSTGNVGSVLSQVGKISSKVLDNPLVGAVLLANPATAPIYVGARAGAFGLQHGGNLLEQAGSLNKRDNSVKFI